MVCILLSECHNTRHSILYSTIRVSQYQAFNRYISVRHSIILVSQYQAFNRYIWFVFYYQSVIILGIQSVHMVCILPSECHNTRHSIGTPIRVQAFNRYIWFVFSHQSVTILGIQSVHMVCILLSEFTMYSPITILGIQYGHSIHVGIHVTIQAFGTYGLYSPIRVSQYQAFNRYVRFVYDQVGIQYCHNTRHSIWYYKVCILGTYQSVTTRHSIGTYGLYSTIRVSQYQAFNRYVWFVFSHQSVTILGIQSVHMVCILLSECHNTRHSIGTYGLYSTIRVSQYQAFNRYIWSVFYYQSVIILGIQSVHMVCILLSECHNTRHSIGTYGLYSPYQSVTILGIQSVRKVCILPSECHNTRHSIGTYGLYSTIRVSQYQAFNRYVRFVFSHQSVTILGIQSVHMVCILPSECHNTRHSIGT